jgi:hypothetical protein
MIKYFLYSDDQIREKNSILGRSGKKFVPGTIAINGTRVEFTQISDKSNMDRFIDTRIVASGELSDFTYTMPKIDLKYNN